MSTKPRRTVLSDALKLPVHEPAPAPAAAPAAVETPAKTKGKAGVVQATLYLPTAVHEQLRTLAFSERVKMHDVVLRGLDREFAALGLKSISELVSL